jgi:hypothetical protein
VRPPEAAPLFRLTLDQTTRHSAGDMGRFVWIAGISLTAQGSSKTKY